MSLVKFRRFRHISATHPGGAVVQLLLGPLHMTNPHNLLITMVNALLALVLSAVLLSPMVFFFAALIGTPVMLTMLIVITLTTRAKAPTDIKRAAAA